MRRAIGKLGLLLLFEAALLSFLHRLDSISWMQIEWGDLIGWLAATAPADAIAAGMRAIALVLAYWLAGSTVLYLIASASRIPAAIRSVEWMTLPAVRRMTDRALAMTLATSSLAGVAPLPAGSLPPPADAVLVTVDPDGVVLPPGTTIDDTPGTTAIPAEATAPDAIVPLPPFPHQVSEIEASTRQVPAQVTVEEGDNLWTISRHRLLQTLGRRPTNEEIAPYWRLVVEHNRPNLISGDPDLIYPGEVIDLPPAEET